MSTLIKINNQKEFKEIYDKFYAGLANCAFSVLKDRDAAKDIVQEVFLDLWNKRATLSIQTSLQAYLVRAVKFKSIDYIRKDKTKQQYIASAVTEDRTFQANSDDDDELEYVYGIPVTVQSTRESGRYDQIVQQRKWR